MYTSRSGSTYGRVRPDTPQHHRNTTATPLQHTALLYTYTSRDGHRHGRSLTCASLCTQDVLDTRIGDVRPLISPACLAEDIPLTARARETVSLSLSVFLSVSLYRALSLTHTWQHSLARSWVSRTHHTHIHTHTCSLSLTLVVFLEQDCTHHRALSVSLSLSYTTTRSLWPSVSLTHVTYTADHLACKISYLETHTYTYVHTHTHTYTHIRTHTVLTWQSCWMYCIAVLWWSHRSFYPQVLAARAGCVAHTQTHTHRWCWLRGVAVCIT